LRNLRLAVALLVVILVHLAGTRLVPDFPRAVDLFLVWVVLAALAGRPAEAIIIGTVAGLTHDALAGGPYGLYGFADTMVGYLVARAAQRLILERVSTVFAAIAVAVVVEHGVVVILTSLLLPQVVPEPLRWWGLQALLSGVVGAAVVGLRGMSRTGREKRLRDRNTKLRLGK